MNHKGGFEGDFRIKPPVSIRGASAKKENKQELLERLQLERQAREACRVKQASAVKIQSYYRGFVTRKEEQDRIRSIFVQSQSELMKQKALSVLDLDELTVQLLFFFESKTDGKLLSWICQMMVKYRDRILDQVTNPSSFWIHRISRLLSLCILNMAWPANQESLAPYFRFIEVFTTPSSFTKNPQDTDIAQAIIFKIFEFQMSKDYFQAVRLICDSKIPPMINETTKPPTPIAESILGLILRPLQMVKEKKEFGARVLSSLTESFFSVPFSEQVRCFVIPSLVEFDFPVLPWISALDENNTQSSSWLLYSFLRIGRANFGVMSDLELIQYMSVLANLTSSILDSRSLTQSTADEDDSDDDDSMDLHESANVADEVVEKSLRLLNDEQWVSSLVNAIESCTEPRAVKVLCRLCHHLLMSDRLAIHVYRILYTLAFRPNTVHRLWNLILDTKQPSIFGSGVPLLTVISRGLRMSQKERDEIVPLLAVFSSLFGYLLVTIHDTEFYGDVETPTNEPRPNRVWMPFSLKELVPMSLSLRDVTLGLVELAFPESRPTVREDYQLAVKSVRADAPETSDTDTKMWSHLFKTTVELVRQLYNRDTRRQFCPDNHWISDRFHLPMDRSNDITLRRSRIRQYRPFQGLRMFTREELEEEGPPLSAKEVRLATILREMPYVISFPQRVLVFSNMVTKDKEEHQGDRANFYSGPSIHVLIRRNYIYEDAFEKLSKENEPNLRLKMRIQLMNAAGLDEAGIDGGGLFREFTSELLKTAFDPNRGFFKLTNNQRLYPNPTVSKLFPEYVGHYYFIGRMLGKALYENMLIELPMATFFLSKLLGQQSANVDIDHLHSLDPELYRNLLYLKTYDGDVQDLGLDFTIVTEEVGSATLEELKPGGRDITVNNENRIEYIHLVADFKLNRQIRTQCNALKQGLADVVNLDWLRMFSHRELQTLISGAEHEIDVEDLRHHTNYSSGYDPQHETVVGFWQVVEEMTESQKRALLKFVTSCSRPPLLGFKELDPPFCVQNAGDDPERLPTASTCMNLLKLPNFKEVELLRTKLLYAIESGAGFELS